ncbi:YbaN family protein [Staphylococcus sp. SQ8-PEA]|uniref:YbaN family protein n=1 Tax=Staphylococcus marylandisciuri TaxID=2981529 RepID=A0ABT2QRA1_9STAP|nr:YbaN family protein [Staphylococcus marylandisciuri]MCU5746472.1 YbaN family protein [Staphylococcus marylandisciuri]
MKYLLITIGIIFTIIGFVGVVLPLLPTTPFLLVAVICFSNSSEKFKNWLVNTKVYINFVESFKKNRGYTLKNKFKLLLSLYIVVGFSFYMLDHFIIRIGLVVMVILQTIVLFTFVRTLPETTKEI